MKKLKAMAWILILTPALATMQAKNKKPYKLPAQFDQARYVYVEALDGQQFNPNLYPEDRQAIADVQKALEDWNRYSLTVKRDEAELIFVVRKGRLADVKAGVQVGPQGLPGRSGGGPGSGSGTGPGAGSGPGTGASGVGVGFGGDVGPPDDYLEVIARNPDHAPGTPLWTRTLADGLDEPDLVLFKQLKDEVERTYPQQAAQAKKP
jgi:hypothetical protein